MSTLIPPVDTDTLCQQQLVAGQPAVSRYIPSEVVNIVEDILCLMLMLPADANELKLKERDVKLVVNASAHQQRLLASQQAKSRLDDNGTAHTNLVVVTGQPMWWVTSTWPVGI